ncbi:serine hydrolase [Reichenbachiella carrageenanivorans]|uniref:Serine hydrolase n=1 Tax=Reichenbachiella carrageenanivorans TaxID=2979869 RepID=A0ABY6CYB4_9BACT|nr:serine hydrolase [Reichenbachiella carrageenanivorans]UXX78360.1 serine hydrolase [Reichenbachiella carrageenanivorans]
MQTYLDSILLRTYMHRVGLLFCLLLIGFGSRANEVPSAVPVEKDTLFTKWMKSKSTLPTLFYELENFNDFSDRIEAESLIRTYGIGGVIVPNGDQEEVTRWVANNEVRLGEPLVHIANLSTVFELPFSGLPDYPSALSVECWTDDSLVYQLGLAHAYTLRGMGIAIVQLPSLPTYYSVHEYHKIATYLNGLNVGQVNYYFTGSALSVSARQSELDLQQSMWLDARQIAEKGLLGKKTLKKYKKATKDDRLVVARANGTQTSIEQIERGRAITFISRTSNPQTLINAILVDGLPNKGFYKQQVKEYYKLLYATQHVLDTPADSGERWEAVRSKFLLKDVTLIQDSYQLLPVRHLGNRKLYTLSNDSSFKNLVDKYKTAIHYPLATLGLRADSLVQIFPSDALILVDLTSVNEHDGLIDLLMRCDVLNAQRPVVAFYEGTGEVLKDNQWQSAMIWNPADDNSKLPLMVETAFGALGINGALPGYYQSDFTRKGVSFESTGRLVYQFVEKPKVDQAILDRIDTLVAHAIQKGMMPGCQIMMVKDGEVVYDKNFGYLTYDSITPVRWNHVYDVASVTKTVATVPALMHRMETGGIHLNGHLSEYLSVYDSTDKGDLTVDDILTHQSGLKSYLPFWQNAKYFSDSATFLYKQRKRKRKYNYLSINWNDSIRSWIAHSKYNSLSNNDGTYRYLYSDLGFILMKDLVEENCACPLDQSVDELIYRPMGMDYTAFNPLNKFPKEQIAPTEQDKYFRAELLQGIVHDKNAALLGGVSGHAGLFSNANDLAKYMQMLLQGGYYGGERYFSDSVVHVFTSKKSDKDRRAMGWDKPYQSVGNASKYASNESFGHSGFTGTLVWADPKYNVVYIFLSNRIYPDPQNYKLIQSNTRTKIHDLMYESFLDFEKMEKETNPGS